MLKSEPTNEMTGNESGGTSIRLLSQHSSRYVEGREQSLPISRRHTPRLRAQGKSPIRSFNKSSTGSSMLRQRSPSYVAGRMHSSASTNSHQRVPRLRAQGKSPPPIQRFNESSTGSSMLRQRSPSYVAGRVHSSASPMSRQRVPRLRAQGKSPPPIQRFNESGTSSRLLRQHTPRYVAGRVHSPPTSRRRVLRNRARGNSPSPERRFNEVKIRNNPDFEDVIELEAPRFINTNEIPSKRIMRDHYIPNPRLYPGPAPQKKRASIERPPRQRRRPKLVFRRPVVPNSRLYRPPPPRPAVRAPPPLRHAAAITKLPVSSPKELETASIVALRLSEQRHATKPRQDNGSQHTTPLLAQLLTSVIERRWKTALNASTKILQVEPNNETAAAFRPLLQQKLGLYNTDKVVELVPSSTVELPPSNALFPSSSLLGEGKRTDIPSALRTRGKAVLLDIEYSGGREIRGSAEPATVRAKFVQETSADINSRSTAGGDALSQSEMWTSSSGEDCVPRFPTANIANLNVTPKISSSTSLQWNPGFNAASTLPSLDETDSMASLRAQFVPHL